MTARKRRAFDPRQLQLLAELDRSLVTIPETPEQSAGLDLDQKTRRWLNEAITKAPLDREQIGQAMSALSGQNITKPMLDSWTGAARATRFPLHLAPAFCSAVGNNHVIEKLAAAMGLRVADTQEAMLARLGQWTLLIAHATEQQRALVAQLPNLPLFSRNPQ